MSCSNNPDRSTLVVFCLVFQLAIFLLDSFRVGLDSAQLISFLIETLLRFVLTPENAAVMWIAGRFAAG
jgi:ABC-type iron transport system FetAB ATPase subunit